MRFKTPLRSRRDTTAAAATSGVALLAAAVAFVANILMARELGPSARGEVAWVLQSAYVLAPLMALGVDRESLRGVGRHLQSAHSHVWLIAIASVTITVGLGYYVAAICFATAAIGASLSIERGVGMAKGSLGTFLWLQVGVQLWVLSSTVGLFVLGVDDPELWVGVYAAPLPIVLALTLSLRGWSFNPRNWRQNFGPVSSTSIRYMFGGFGSLMASRVERLILPVLASTEALGLYVAVATASEMLVWAGRGLGESRVVGFMGGSLTRVDLAKRAVRDFIFFALLAVPLAAGIRFLLLPLLGPSFEPASVLIVPLCLASAAWACYLQISSAWLARGSVGQSMKLDIGAAALTTVCVAALIPSLGALGAALGCLLAYSIMIIVAVRLLPAEIEDRDHCE